MNQDHKHSEYQYLDLLQDIMDNGSHKVSHSTGIGLKSVFGRQIRFDLSQGFPLLTTKKVFMRGITHELLWFLSGKCDNVKYLMENNVHIWDDWAYKPYMDAVEKGDEPEMTLEEFAEKVKTDEVFAKK